MNQNRNSTQNKSQTHRAKQYEVTSFLSTDCELSTDTCSKNVYSLGPWFDHHILCCISITEISISSNLNDECWMFETARRLCRRK